MSADTYLYIDRKKKEVWMCTASCVCPHKKHCLKCQKSYLIGKGKTVDELLDIASNAENDLDLLVEYGISTELWCK